MAELASTTTNGSLPQKHDSVPEIPHITANMTPLNVILERISLDTFKKLKEFFKYLESSPDLEIVKKKHFLELLVSFRENFVRLYVLCKWSRNHEFISKLIDLFVWLREQNQYISNCIMSFGGIKPSLITAKMPEPDLSTSLEVLLQGRPTLPTYNFIPTEYEKITPEFTLKFLKNLNVELAIKMALEERIPKPFQNFKIKDGCIHFNLPNYFSCSISMLNDNKFHLIDFKLDFELCSNKIQQSIKKLDTKNFMRVQQYVNHMFHENESSNLEKLYDFLYDIAIKNKLNLLNKQLTDLRMGLWRGHLSHTYNSENSIITITYWVQKKYTKPSSIQIGKFDNDEKLSFKWFKNEILTDAPGIYLLEDNGDIDLLNLLNSIIKLHINSIILDLKKSLVETVEECEKLIIVSSNSDKLAFQISQSKQILYSIDIPSGSCYFENPTNTMNRSAFKINTGNSLDFIEILRLKMLIQEDKFIAKMNATGWVNLTSIRLSDEEISKLNINYTNLKNKNIKNILTSITVYRRKDWPIGWFILVSHFGFQSNIQLWCSKIQSVEGQWIINWCSKINLSELTENSPGLSLPSESSVHSQNSLADQNYNVKSLSYNDMINLIKNASSKLISNLIVKELADDGCQIKVLNSSDNAVNEFLSNNFNVKNDLTKTDNAVLLIKNKSLFHIESARESIVVVITIKNSHLNAIFYGKLTDDKNLKALPDIKYGDVNDVHSFGENNDDQNTILEYNSQSKIFKIESNVDLSHQFTPAIDSPLVTKNNTLILTKTLIFLKKFAKLLNLLKLVSSNSALNILEVTSNGVTFKYGDKDEEYIQLNISHKNYDNITIELPENNPHYPFLNYLNSIISAEQMTPYDIKELVLYLRMTLEFCRKIQQLTKENEVNLKNFNDENELIDFEANSDGLKTMPTSGFIPITNTLENLTISYFKGVKLDILQQNNKYKKTKSVSDIFKFDIKVQLVHRSKRVSLKHSMFYITLGSVRSETTGVIKSTKSITNACIGENNELLNIFNQVTSFVTSYFNGENFTLDLGKGSVVFLKDGICCDCNSIEIVFDYLHHQLISILNN